MNATAMYGAALERGEGAVRLRERDGRARTLPVGRWLGPVTPAEERVLDRAEGPVIDVGCGPGRHVGALARRGVEALGVDVAPVAVRLAQRRGATVLRASIFDAIPGAGTYRTALLLDGNIGIGGSPGSLLARIGALLTPGGRVLAEVDPPGTGLVDLQVRLETPDQASEWFAWAHVGADALAIPAATAGLAVTESWYDEGRWFAALEAAR